MARESKLIHLLIEGRLETALIPQNTTDQAVYDLILGVSGFPNGTIIKLKTKEGDLLCIDADIPPNQQADPYEVVAVGVSVKDVTITNQTSEQFTEIENRLNTVEEKIIMLKTHLPPAVEELKSSVNKFKKKFEQAETFSWLNQCKDGVGMPGVRALSNDVHPYWKHVQYRRKISQEVLEVVTKYGEIWDSVVSEETKELLRLPSFNTWAWKDWELLLMLQFMFQDLNLLIKLGVSLGCLRSFLCVVYKHYNQVPFHNFRHAFSVAQMMYGMICKCHLQQRLGDIDILILITSCICHDLDHPGFNNIYQINAKTELALRYNDISPLENHHCAIAFSILENEENNLLRSIPIDDYKRVREGIIRCILATDMARHNEILQDFREALPIFDWQDRLHLNLLFMVMIKVADISNEARPLDIAEPWLECLMQEFFNQSDLEKLEGLPVSPFMDREKVTKPSSQCSFIGFVLMPLFESLGELLPELEELIIQPVRDALEHYRRLNEVCKKMSDVKSEGLITPEEIPKLEEPLEDSAPDGSEEYSTHSSNSPEHLRRILSKTESFTSIKSRTSSKTSGFQRAASSRDTDPDYDPAETEVEVSERTSRFKISTETHRSNSRRNSYERKNSIDGRGFERTVSPRLLEERLRPHAETELEQCPSPNLPSVPTSPFPPAPMPSPTPHGILSTSRTSTSVSAQASPSQLSNKVKHFDFPTTVSPIIENEPTSREEILCETTEDAEDKSETKDNPTSILSRLWFFSEKSTSVDKPPKRVPETKQGVLKKNKGNSDPGRIRPPLSKGKITFKSDDEVECTPMPVHNSNAEMKTSSSCDPLTWKEDDHGTVQFSPTLSDKCSVSSNSVMRHKKFSLSLDVLPRRNGKSRKDCSTPHNTPRESNDDLLSNEAYKSPKSKIKKKHDSVRAIFFRSLSFRKKPSNKESPKKSSPTKNSPTQIL